MNDSFPYIDEGGNFCFYQNGSLQRVVISPPEKLCLQTASSIEFQKNKETFLSINVFSQGTQVTAPRCLALQSEKIVANNLQTDKLTVGKISSPEIDLTTGSFKTSWGGGFSHSFLLPNCHVSVLDPPGIGEFGDVPYALGDLFFFDLPEGITTIAATLHLFCATTQEAGSIKIYGSFLTKNNITSSLGSESLVTYSAYPWLNVDFQLVAGNPPKNTSGVLGNVQVAGVELKSEWKVSCFVELSHSEI